MFRELMMRTDVYLRRDIAAILNAVLVAQGDLIQHASTRSTALYSAGFVAAIRAIAAGFAIDPETELNLSDYWVAGEGDAADSRITSDRVRIIPIDTSLMIRDP
jgi:hypothetical protein